MKPAHFTLSMIVAVAQNGVIGADNDMPWHLPEDLKHFKKLTSGHKIIMGRRTFESLPFGPLPKRVNIVITRQADLTIEGCVMATSPEQALEHCEAGEEVFVIGGGNIYRQFMPLADKLYITRIHQDFDGDTCFPEMRESEWEKVGEELHGPTDKHEFSFSFVEYRRKV